MELLPSLPESLVDLPFQHIPLGTFSGHLPYLNFKHLSSRPWQRFTHQKHWMFLSLTADPIFMGIAIVDLSYATKAFLFVYDQQKMSFLVHFSKMGPPLLAGVKATPTFDRMAWFRFGGVFLCLYSSLKEERYELTVHAPHLLIEAELSGREAPAPLSAIGTHGPGLLHTTEKSVFLNATGQLRVNGTLHSLNHGIAGLDYTHGYLPHRMDWRWAFAQGHAKTGESVAFNIADGSLGESECALWINQELIPISKGEFQFSNHTSKTPWRISSLHKTVDLLFYPEEFHKEKNNYVFVSSDYIQGIGRFSGSISLPNRPTLLIDKLIGVTEAQKVSW